MSTLTEEQFVTRVVPTLPQGACIKQEDARRWYQSVMELDPQRLTWHIARLKGLGGSDVGAVAAWKMGVFNIFKTPRDIIDEKLLRRPIEPQNKDMRRGTYLEPIIQRLFWEDYGAVSRPDLIDAVLGHQCAEYPWMRGNPDDIVEIAGRLYVVDYKSPSDAHEAQKGLVPLQYAAQVHQYGFLLAEETGSKADSHLVACYDHANGEVAAVDVPYNADIMAAVLCGGDEIWAHVVNGTYPESQTHLKNDLTFDAQQRATIAQLEATFIRQKLLADAAYTSLKKTAEALENEFRAQQDVLLKGQKLPLEVLGATVRQTIDEEVAYQVIQNAGLDPQAFMVASNKLDTSKVMAALETAGLPPEEFFERKLDLDKVVELCEAQHLRIPVKESFSLALRASKKGLDQDVLARAKASASQIVNDGICLVDLGDETDASPAAK
jgi:hypothetical protein